MNVVGNFYKTNAEFFVWINPFWDYIGYYHIKDNFLVVEEKLMEGSLYVKVLTKNNFWWFRRVFLFDYCEQITYEIL